MTDFGPVHEGLSEQAWLALLDAQSAGLLDRVDFIETVDIRDREPNISAFSEQGYDIIVTVGAGISDETIAAARTFPELRFLGVQQSMEGVAAPDNYATLVFHEERSGFLAGAMAGLITRTGHVAAVCEAEFIDSIRRTCNGFRIGAKFVEPAIEADVIYRTGPEELLFRDVKWGRAAAELSVDQGADVVFAIGHETAEAALEAAAARGGQVIGAEIDQYAQLPGIRTQLVTSAVLDIRSGLLSLLQESLGGAFSAGPHWGEVGLAPFHDFEGKVAPMKLLRLQEIEGALETGVIHVDVSR